MNLLIAPTAFKGTLNPLEASLAIAEGARQAVPNATLDLCPLADGGTGWLEVWEFHAQGNAERIHAVVPDALGNPIHAEWLLWHGTVAVIESARACGIHLLPPKTLRPLDASSEGVGFLLKEAVQHPQVPEIWLGLGGTATTDGGTGVLRALGYQLLREDGTPAPAGGKGLGAITHIVPPETDPLRGKRLVLCADVENPLVGERGSARVYAPQKGATPEQVEVLEQNLYSWGTLIERTFGVSVLHVPGAGSAGGMGGGLYGVLGAPLVSGTAWLLRQIGWEARLRRADYLLTGEGQVDSQTLMGKGVGMVIQQAIVEGKPVIVLAGRRGKGAEALERLPQVRVCYLAEQFPTLPPVEGLQLMTLNILRGL